jgi:hypothetical protein
MPGPGRLSRIMPVQNRLPCRLRTTAGARRPHPQRTFSTLAVWAPHLPCRGSGLPGALGALPAGPEQIREGPRKACRAARRRGPTKKMPGPAATRRDAAPWAARFVPARRKGATLPSSPRLAAHPRARASRQRSPGGRTPGPIGAGTRLPSLRSGRQDAHTRAENVLDSYDRFSPCETGKGKPEW